MKTAPVGRSSSRTSSRSVSPSKQSNASVSREDEKPKAKNTKRPSIAEKEDEECPILKNDDILNAVAALSTVNALTSKTRSTERHANNGPNGKLASPANDLNSTNSPTIKFGPKIVLNKKSKGSSLLSSSLSGSSSLLCKAANSKSDEDANRSLPPDEAKVDQPSSAIASVTNVIRNKFISLLKK